MPIVNLVANVDIHKSLIHKFIFNINGLRALAGNFKNQNTGIKHLSFSAYKPTLEKRSDFSVCADWTNAIFIGLNDDHPSIIGAKHLVKLFMLPDDIQVNSKTNQGSN